MSSSPRASSLGRTPSTRSNSKRNIFEVDVTALKKEAEDGGGSSEGTTTQKLSKKWRREVSRDFSVSQLDDVGKVKEVIADRTTRSLLMKQLVPLKPDFANKLKFCASVEDYDKAAEKDKRSKARKLVSLYVDPGAAFLLVDLPESMRQALVAGKYEEDLDRVRQYYAQQLVHCPVAKPIVDELFEQL